MKPITVWDVAKARGVVADEDGSVSGSEFARVGLPMMGGCLVCGATIAAYNASPTSTGFLMCTKGCASEDGFATVEDYEAWQREEEQQYHE